ncbi:MAG: uroporphyrinogen decarboxylase family protein [Candidatus Latescibacterota bacterium]
MTELTGVERIGNILRRRPVDRIGLYEHFWGDTLQVWRQQGHIRADEDLDLHFGFDMSLCWPLNMVARLDFQPQVLEETEETVVTRDGNGAVLRRHKLHSSTPEHIDFEVKERRAWEEQVKSLLTPSRQRINFEAYRNVKAEAHRRGRFFCWSGVNAFELMHPVCGHQYMLMGMADDPDWVRDMADTYAGLTVQLMEILFAEEGLPDGIWFYEDMGFKERPFMSPRMYRQIVQPAHARTFAHAHCLGLPVIVHSCGFIEPLLPDLVDAGLDCLQVMEVKAGMDPLRIKRRFGDRIVLFGGMDARNLVANDRDAIRAELAAKIPVLKEGYGYILHSDHSIPTTTEYETYRFFVDEGLRLGRF